MNEGSPKRGRKQMEAPSLEPTVGTGIPDSTLIERTSSNLSDETGLSEHSLPSVPAATNLHCDYCLNFYEALPRAQACIEEVKNTLDDTERVYQFRELLKDLAAGRIDPSELIARLKDLFRDQSALAVRLNAYLPEDQQIPVELVEVPSETKQYQVKRYSRRYDTVGDGAEDNGTPSFNLEMDERIEEKVNDSWEIKEIHKAIKDGNEEKQKDRSEALPGALAFIEEVKNTHLANTEKVDQFLKLTKDLAAGRIDRSEALARLKDLFRDHWALAVELNANLGEDREIPVELVEVPSETKQYLVKRYSRRYDRVGDGAEDNGGPSFNLEMDERMEEKVNDSWEIKEIHKAMKAGNEEKQKDRSEALPGALAFIEEVKNTQSDDTEKIYQFLKLTKDLAAGRIDRSEATARRKDLMRGHWALAVGLNTYLPEDHRIPVEIVDAPSESKRQSRRYKRVGDGAEDNGTPSFNPEMDDGIGEKEKHGWEIKEIHKATKTGDEEKQKDRSGALQAGALAFLKEVKNTQLDDTEKIDQFLKLTKDLAAGRIDRSEALARLKDLFRDYLALTVGENAYLPEDQQIPVELVEVPSETKHYLVKRYSRILNKRVRDAAEEIGMPSFNLEKDERIEEKEHNSWELEETHKAMEAGDDEQKDLSDDFDCSIQQETLKAGDEEQQKDLIDDSIQRLQRPKWRYVKQHDTKHNIRPNIRKAIWKQCEQAKQNERSSKPSCTSSTKLSGEVVNDNSASVKSIEEYEHKLFRCEDEQFEVDMMIERLASTTQRVSELMNGIGRFSEFNEQKSTFAVEDHLSDIHLRCINTIYVGDSGMEFLDFLREDPVKGLVVILIRLKEMHDEWSRYRKEMGQVWTGFRSKLETGLKRHLGG